MTTINPPSEDALELLENCPAIYVNAFLYFFADVAKVVMCEQNSPNGKVTPRACVLLTEQNADYLIAALQDWKAKKADYQRNQLGTFIVPPEGKPN